MYVVTLYEIVGRGGFAPEDRVVSLALLAQPQQQHQGALRVATKWKKVLFNYL